MRSALDFSRQKRLVISSTEYVVHGGEEGCFEEAHHEPVRRQFSERVCSILQQGEESPKDIHGGDSPVHGDVGEQEHEGHHANNCADCVHCLEFDELIALEAQLLLHSSDVGIVFFVSV